MTNPTNDGFVEILQSDLDTFASEFEAIREQLITYIAELKAAAVIPAASEAGLTQALNDLTSLVPPTPPLSA